MSDAVLDRQLQAMAFMFVGIGLVSLALYLRLRIFIGNRPGGVDTWYYLASAEAIRRQKRLPISLPQYLLQEDRESYPAVFPVFLALFPPDFLKKYFWLISPAIDSLHLLILYLLSYRLTDSIIAAGTAGFIYAVTPQLISETRSLNGRAFASLLQSLAMVALLRSIIPSTGPSQVLIGKASLVFPMVALLLIAMLYNTHTSTTIALLIGVATLSIVNDDPRFVLFGLAGFPLAIVLSGGYYLRVIRNHVHAAQFWRRNVHLTRAHQIEDSPVLGLMRASPAARGMYSTRWRARVALAARVLGENPFVLAMLVTPVPVTTWATSMYWWAIAILGLAIATTFIGPLRILGPGFYYMKASVFPSAYALSVTVNGTEGKLSLVGVTLVICIFASFAALAYFYRVMAIRATEHTAQTPPDLAEATALLNTLPGKSVLVLPNVYADYVAYNARKSVVWGGHSGNLNRFEEFFPVLRRPVSYFLEQYAVDYVLLDQNYATAKRLEIDDAVETIATFGSLILCSVRQHITARPEPETRALKGAHQASRR